MDLREARTTKGWSQQEAAKKLGVSQGYLSFLEAGRRRPSPRVRRRLAEVLGLPTTVVPLAGGLPPSSLDELVSDLAGLGYPGFQHLSRHASRKHPVDVLLRALNQNSLEPRVAEALPWVVYQYPDLEWDWLVNRVKTMDLQNRLGFVVTLGRQLAERRGNGVTAEKLSSVETTLDRSRLVREDVFGRTSLTQAETRWLREFRPAPARHWNVLSNLSVENLHVAW